MKAEDLKVGYQYKTIIPAWLGTPAVARTVTVTRVGAHSVWWRVEGSGKEGHCRLSAVGRAMPREADAEAVAKVEAVEALRRARTRVEALAHTAEQAGRIEALKAAIAALTEPAP